MDGEIWLDNISKQLWWWVLKNIFNQLEYISAFAEVGVYA